MNKLLLTGIAVLFLATGTAYAENMRVELMLFRCSGTEVTLWEEIYPNGGRSKVLEMPSATMHGEKRGSVVVQVDDDISYLFEWKEGKAELRLNGVKCEVIWPAEEG